MRLNRSGLGIGAAILLLLAGCGTSTPTGTPTGTSAASPSGGSSATPSGTPGESASPSRSAASSSAPAARTVSKVLVFVVENHSLEQMRTAMPFVHDLATTFAYADQYRALTHPSLPNYLAIVGGTTSGVADDEPPSVHGRHGRSVFGQALAAGRTAAVYADGMPGPCALEDGGDRYAVRHNGWAYQLDERAACRRFDLPLAALAPAIAAGRLPNVGMVIPNTCHDAHDCGLGEADAWFDQQIGRVMAGPDWRSGRLAVVVTADEDDHHQDNQVLTVVAHPSLRGLVVHDPLTHLSLSRALSEVAGGEPLADAAGAASLWTSFGLVPAPG